MKSLSILALLAATGAFGSVNDSSLNQLADRNLQKVICTTEYDPSTCVYQDLKFQGTNRCLASASLYAYAKAHDIVLKSEDVKCYSGEWE